MKKFYLLSLAFILSMSAFSQVEDPVNWNFTTKKIAKGQYEIHLTATVEKGWHIYSQDAGEGPEPTSFVFSKNPLIKYEGKVKEVGKLESLYDPNFKSTLKFYNNSVDFIQKLTLKSTATTMVKGTLTYMVCNDKRCLPPKDVKFSLKIDGK